MSAIYVTKYKVPISIIKFHQQGVNTCNINLKLTCFKNLSDEIMNNNRWVGRQVGRWVGGWVGEQVDGQVSRYNYNRWLKLEIKLLIELIEKDKILIIHNVS